MDQAAERELLMKQILESVKTYTPAEKVDEYFRMKVRLKRVPVELLREIVEQDTQNISEAARMALGIGARA